MGKFKVGDLVEVVLDVYYDKYVSVGEKYRITKIGIEGGAYIVDKTGDEWSPDDWTLELVKEQNPMPQLEAGMVVVDSSGDSILYVHDNLWLNASPIGGGIAGSRDVEISKKGVCCIYKHNGQGLGSSFGIKGELIWQRTPEKTEAQIKLEKIQESISELQEQANELEKEL